MLLLSQLLLSKLFSLALGLRLFAFSLRFLWFLARALEVASPSSPPPRWATFFGPYRHLVGVRAIGWSACFEERMVASVEAQDLEEHLVGVEAFVADLITAKEVEDMASASRTWDFGPWLMTQDMVKALEASARGDDP